MVFREAIPTLSIAEKFLSLENFLQAFTKVAAKKGSPGVDGESIEDFRKNLRANVSQLRDEVANNKYQPLPCKRASIGKGNGEFREIRIPTVRGKRSHAEGFSRRSTRPFKRSASSGGTEFLRSQFRLPSQSFLHRCG